MSKHDRLLHLSCAGPCRGTSLIRNRLPQGSSITGAAGRTAHTDTTPQVCTEDRPVQYLKRLYDTHACRITTHVALFGQFGALWYASTIVSST